MDRAFPDLTPIDDALLEALLFAVTFHPMAHVQHALTLHLSLSRH